MRNPRILITGGTGLLGKTLLGSAPEGWEVVATFHRHPPPEEWRAKFALLDVRDESAVVRLFESVRPNVVIHTASIGSVDEAERSPTVVRQVNIGGTQAVGRACLRLGAALVFISSNAVFDGTHPPYAEDAPVRAVNRYGMFKIEAENWVREHHVSSMIIRPILMYGWPWPGGRQNVVTRWLDGFERGQSVEVAHDVSSKPLVVEDCAEAIWAAVTQRRRGTYHVAGADHVSLVTFAKETARIFGYDAGLVVSVPSSRWTALAPRPRDTSFLTTRMEQELGVRPLGIRDGLALMQRTRAVNGLQARAT